MEKTKLELTKENYKKIQKEFNLPDFKELNEDFQIEKIKFHKTENPVREIRKFLTEKMGNYMRLIEALINPSSSPMFVFAMTKTLKQKDKQKLVEIYKEFSKFQLDLIKIDLDFSEKNEAEFVNKYFKKWKEIKKDFMSILEVIESNWDNKVPVDNGKDYFG